MRPAALALLAMVVAPLIVACGASGVLGGDARAMAGTSEILKRWIDGGPANAPTFGQAGGAAASDVSRAEQDVAQAWLMLQRARAEQTRVVESPEERELRAAEREVAIAQSRAVRARLDVQRLSGPDPALVVEADRAVERAEATLRAARSARPSRDVTDATSEREAAISNAALALQQAIERRGQIVAGPAAEEIEAARRADAGAQVALRAASDRLTAARERWREAAPDVANAALESAQDALSDAEARLRAARQRDALATSR